jgi:hypothetical protein
VQISTPQIDRFPRWSLKRNFELVDLESSPVTKTTFPVHAMTQPPAKKMVSMNERHGVLMKVFKFSVREFLSATVA